MNKLIISITTLALATSLTGCLNEDDDNKGVSCNSDQPNMAIQTIAPDYSSSAVALGCSKDAVAQDKLLVKESSDFRVSSSSHLYHIDRTKSLITQYNFGAEINGDQENWEYNVNDSGDEAAATTANPYKVIQVSANKAYVIRYNKLKAWIVNPQAQSADEFKMGELDLSAYAATVTVEGTDYKASAVDMSDAVVVDDKLYIAMQRLRNGSKTSSGYDALDYTNDAKVAVFNVKTDEEIGTAFNLTGHNVIALEVEGSNIYAVSRGDYASDFGAIDVINSKNNTISASIVGTEQTGHLVDITVHKNTAYLLTDNSGYDVEAGAYVYRNDIYNLDLAENTIGEKYEFLAGSNIPAIAEGPEGYLWVLSAKADNPGVYKLDAQTFEVAKNSNDQDAFIETELNPITIVFKQ